MVKFILYSLVIILLAMRVHSHDALGYAKEVDEDLEISGCIECVMSGYVFCNPTQKCYSNWGGILGKDCT